MRRIQFVHHILQRVILLSQGSSRGELGDYITGSSELDDFVGEYAPQFYTHRVARRVETAIARIPYGAAPREIAAYLRQVFSLLGVEISSHWDGDLKSFMSLICNNLRLCASRLSIKQLRCLSEMEQLAAKAYNSQHGAKWGAFFQLHQWFLSRL